MIGMASVEAMKRVLITGPECSGKSTLSKGLAENWQVPLLPELARPYLKASHGNYRAADLRVLRSLHELAELTFKMSSCKVLICDTGPLVLHIWMLEKFGTPLLTNRELHALDYDLLVICKPVLPWRFDPLRENPHDRDRLFEKYVNCVQQCGMSYMIAEGDIQQRLKQVTEVWTADN